MKKILSIALICALCVGSFSSCVKTDESASVTNIRNQKAEQLKSLAAFNNAQAEATKILAEAEVKIKTAEAAYKQAQAAYEQAIADGQKIENEKAQLLLNKAKATLELEIQAAKLQAEAAVKQAEAALEIAKAQLILAMDNASEAEKARINTLIESARLTLATLNTAKTNLVKEKSTKIQLEYDLIDAQQAMETQITEKKEKIALNKALIADLEKISPKDKEAAVAAWNTAKNTLAVLGDKNTDAYAKYEAVRAEIIRDYVDFSTGIFSVSSVWQNGYYFLPDGNSTCPFLRNLLRYYKDMNGNIIQPAYKYIASKPYTKKEEFTQEDGTPIYNGYIGFISGRLFTLKAETLNNDKAPLQREVTIATSALAEANKALTDRLASDEYKALIKALDDAKAEFEKAKTAQEQQIAKNKIETAQYNLDHGADMQKNAVSSAESNLEGAQYNLDELQFIEDLFDSKNANYVFYLASFEKYKALMDKYFPLRVEYLKANYNYQKQLNLVTSLEKIQNNLVDYPAEIANLQTEITQLERMIADMSSVTTKKDAIAKCEIEIARLETQIKALEKQYNDYKAQIDALVK